MGYQKTIDRLRAENEELKSKLQETYEDEQGNVWVDVKETYQDKDGKVSILLWGQSKEW